jgi:hypothetical protein
MIWLLADIGDFDLGIFMMKRLLLATPRRYGFRLGWPEGYPVDKLKFENTFHAVRAGLSWHF